MTTQERIRHVVSQLRTTSMRLSDLIPLMQEAADKLDELERGCRCCGNPLNCRQPARDGS